MGLSSKSNGQRAKRTRAALSWVALALWMVVIFYFSAKNAADSQGMSNGVIATLMALLPSSFDSLAAAIEALSYPVRKSAHFLEYLVLGLLAANALVRTGRLWDSKRSLAPLLVMAWVLASLYAATDEFHQLFVPGRSGQLSDVALDSCGCAVGCLAFALGSRIRKRKAAGENGCSPT